MKIFRHKKLGLGILLALAFVTESRAQTAFQNLNFESANVPAVQPNETVPMSMTQGMLGWHGYTSTNATLDMIYNGISGGLALTTLIGPDTAGYSNRVVEGNFTAVISSGGNPLGGSPFVSCGIGQTGLVPPGAQAVFFSLGTLSSVSDLQVSFDGHVLPFYFFATGPNYNVYGADISGYAGASGELLFTELPVSFPFTKAYLDDIYFSSTPIPEPSTLSLFGLGLLGLLWHCRRNVRVRSYS